MASEQSFGWIWNRETSFQCARLHLGGSDSVLQTVLWRIRQRGKTIRLVSTFYCILLQLYFFFFRFIFFTFHPPFYSFDVCTESFYGPQLISVNFEKVEVETGPSSLASGYEPTVSTQFSGMGRDLSDKHFHFSFKDIMCIYFSPKKA
jgi:hypothetical protein